MIAFIDNHDSFSYNLIYLLESLQQKIHIYNPENIDFSALNQSSHIIISPGPKHPKDTPILQDIIHLYHKEKPILGVCLGHQCIAYAFGADVVKGKEPIHGKTSKIRFEPNLLFANFAQDFIAMRYHSLVVQNLPKTLKPIAWSEDGVIMALQLQDFPVYGVQFHPESILSQYGEQLLKNFLLL